MMCLGKAHVEKTAFESDSSHRFQKEKEDLFKGDEDLELVFEDSIIHESISDILKELSGVLETVDLIEEEGEATNGKNQKKSRRAGD